VDHILVVEDKKSMRRMLAQTLQAEGYQVVEAEDGPQALECLREGLFDLVFLDLQMPGMHGLDVLSEIHRDWPRLPVCSIGWNPGLPMTWRSICWLTCG